MHPRTGRMSGTWQSCQDYPLTTHLYLPGAQPGSDHRRTRRGQPPVAASGCARPARGPGRTLPAPPRRRPPSPPGGGLRPQRPATLRTTPWKPKRRSRRSPALPQTSRRRRATSPRDGCPAARPRSKSANVPGWICHVVIHTKCSPSWASFATSAAAAIATRPAATSLCNYFLPLAAIADGAVPLTRAVTSSNRMTVRPQRQVRRMSSSAQTLDRWLRALRRPTAARTAAGDRTDPPQPARYR